MTTKTEGSHTSNPGKLFFSSIWVKVVLHLFVATLQVLIIIEVLKIDKSAVMTLSLFLFSFICQAVSFFFFFNNINKDKPDVILT